MKKTIIFLVFPLLLILVFAMILAIGCGKQTPTSSTTNYTISGTVPNSQAQSMGIGAKATTVTHIVAIGANDSQTLATLNSDGSFTVPITSGYPYVLGFFNKSGSTITLLGYLRKADVNWDSLPLISPAGSSTNLGTVTVEASSVEATPSIDLTTLIGQMNMDLSTANLYGAIDDPLTALTNLDMDGNGQFDFQESKDYLFQIYVGMNTSGGYVTGEVDRMISGYNDTYVPTPGFYQFVLAGRGDTQANGASGTIKLPQAITNSNGTTYTTGTGTVQADSAGTTWSLFFYFGNSPATLPATAPSGIYTMEAGSTTYTVRNFKATNALALGSNNNIVYPVFHLVTDANGYITTAQYKWKKLSSGSIVDATAAEVKAIIEDTASVTTGFSHTSPFISFFKDANTLHGSIIKFDRDGSSVNVSSLNIKRADIHHIQFSYNLSSRVVCKFDMQ